MIYGLLAAVVFFFVAIGAVVFVICGILPPLRRFGLSAALWCAMWGPCIVAWIILGGVAAVAEGVAIHPMSFYPPGLLKDVSVVYVIVGVLGTIVVASVSAWLHQIVIHRVTFALFQLYAAAVSAGIGSVWGLALGIGLQAEDVPHSIPLWCFGMVVLCAAFGYAGFRWAKQLRGPAPTGFTLVTREEFEGTA